MLKVARTLFVLGMIFAATLVMSPWRLGDRSLQNHMESVVERTGTQKIVQRSQNAFESQADNLRQKIPQAFDAARRKLATWINPASPEDPRKQD